MRIGSLFSGIGGLDLGFERVGGTVVWFCEADVFCQRALAKHWPDAPCYPDVTQLTAATLPPVDVLIGGFPCQDVSDAGKREGLTDDNRSGLWFHYARLIREFHARPDGCLRAVAIENVPGLFVRGFERVLGDLASIGFDAEWEVIRASDVGAPHRRARVFIVAYPQRGELGQRDGGGRQPEAVSGSDGAGVLADAASLRGPGRDEQADLVPAGHRDAGRSELAQPHRGRQREPAVERDATGFGAGMADPEQRESGERRDAGSQRGRSADPEQTGLGGERSGMADAERRPTERKQRPGNHPPAAGPGGRGGDESKELRSSRGGSRLADATSAGSQGHQPEASDRGIHGVDLRPDARVAVFWPARPGEAQHAWEPPRCLESALGAGLDGVPRGLARWRRAALQATGNAVVPQVAEVVARRVRHLLIEGK